MVHFSSFCAPAILQNRTQYGPGKACHQMENAGRMAERVRLRRDGDTHDVHATRTQPRVCTSHQELQPSDHAHQSLPTQSAIQLSMIFTVKFPFTKGSTTSVKYSPPSISAATALHSFSKWQGDFTDSDPSVCVGTFNRDATSARKIVFGAAVPPASYRFPFPGQHFIHRKFLSTLFTPKFASSSASWLCSLKTCCTKSPVLISRVATGLLHHENKAFCTVPISLLEALFHLEFSIYPLRSHVTVSLQQYRRAFLVWR